MTDEDVVGFEALWDSMMKCRRGTVWKTSVAAFVLNAVPEVAKLSDELESGRYQERKHKYFTVRYPKERQIMSISFRDRVYQRSLNDVAIYPAMSRSFIYDNAACQKGKWTDFARGRIKCHMQRYYRKHGAEGYVLQMDIRKYYQSMRHDVAKDVFRKRLEPFAQARAEKILDGFPGEMGFNPGSQIIQIAGISVLDGIDHYIKERLRMKHYLRYMDDIIVIARTREELENVQAETERKLKEIGFSLHPEKTRIYPLKKGVLCLGYRFRLTETGKVVMSLDPERIKAAMRKYRRLAVKCRRGEITREKVDESYLCFRNHASKGDGYRMLNRLDEFYHGLWEETEHAENHQTEIPPGRGRENEPAQNGAGSGTASQ